VAVVSGFFAPLPLICTLDDSPPRNSTFCVTVTYVEVVCTSWGESTTEWSLSWFIELIVAIVIVINLFY